MFAYFTSHIVTSMKAKVSKSFSSFDSLIKNLPEKAKLILPDFADQLNFHRIAT